MAAQISAVSIFVIMFILIITEKIERHIVTLLSGFATLVVVFGFFMKDMAAVTRTLNVAGIFTKGFWFPVESTGQPLFLFLE